MPKIPFHKLFRRLILILIIGLVVVSILFLLKNNLLKSTSSEKVKVIEQPRNEQKNPDIYNYTHSYLEEAFAKEDVNDYDSAIYYYRIASEKFKQEKNHEGYTWTLNQIGNIYINTYGYDFRKALPYLELVLEYDSLHLDKDHPFAASSYFYFGLYFYKLKNATKALQNLNQALSMRLNYFGEQNIYVANIYTTIGDVHAFVTYEIQKAEQNYLKGLTIKETILPVDNPSFVFSYYNLSQISQVKGDFEKASTWCFQALEKSEFVNANKEQWKELLNGTLGALYFEQKQFQKAIQKNQYAIDLNNLHSQEKSQLAFYYSNLAAAYSGLHEYKAAIQYYEKSLETMNTFTHDEREIYSIYADLGEVYKKMNQFKPAFHYYTKCLQGSRNIFGNRHQKTGEAYQKLGKLYSDYGIYDSALYYYQHSIACLAKNINTENIYLTPTLSTLDTTYYASQVIGNKAFALKQMFEQDTTNIKALQTSLSHYCLADTLISLSRFAYEREKTKLNDTERHYSIYEEGIDCAFRLYQVAKKSDLLAIVLNLIERRKANILVEALFTKKSESKYLSERSGIFTSQKENYLYLQAKLEEESRKDQPDEDILAAIHSKLHILEKEQRMLMHEEEKKFHYNLHPDFDLQELMELSEENKSAILNYFWGDRFFYTLGISGEKIHFEKREITPAIQQHLEEFTATLKQGYNLATQKKDYQSFCRSSYALYENLCQPVTSIVNASIKKITIVPDGVLSEIPFEALVTRLPDKKNVNYKNLSYLINDYAIAYEYSAKLLSKEFIKKNMATNRKILAFGFNHKENTTLPSTRENQLPGTSNELKALEKLIAGKYFYGIMATEKKFKEEVGSNYEILHLAIHGQADESNAYTSRLLFHPDKDSTEDGYLYPYELHHLKINTNLVVLSACESGSGKNFKGEGTYSLARGFIYSGSPSVIMSLWQVNDLTTIGIMKDFYKSLSDNTPIDISLQMAKINYLHDANSRNAHPSYWAPFICLGDTNPIAVHSPFTFNNYWPIALSLGLTLLIGGFYVIKKKIIVV